MLLKFEHIFLAINGAKKILRKYCLRQFLGHFPSFFLSLQEIHTVIETPSKASIVKEKSRATLLLCARVLR